MMKAVILAAGKGTRLIPLTLTTPKPLIQISGKPIIDRIFESLPNEIDEVIVIVEHLKEKIRSHAGENFLGKKVTYADQGEKKGTFGALLSARDMLDENERFLVLNGDDLHSQEELNKYLEHPRSLGIQKINMPNYYSVDVDESGLIRGFRSQTDSEKEEGALVATGAYVIDSDIFKHPGIEVYGGEYGLPQTILAQKESYPIHAIITEHWTPINSFEDINKAEKFIFAKSKII